MSDETQKAIDNPKDKAKVSMTLNHKMERELRSALHIREKFLERAKADKIDINNSDFVQCIRVLNEHIDKLRIKIEIIKSLE